MLVNMEVYRKLKWPWYAECYKWVGDNNLEAFKNQMRGYFTTVPPPEVLDSIQGTAFGDWLEMNYSVAVDVGSPERYFSEDLYLIRQAQRAGFTVWCCLDTSFATTHLGTMNVTCERPTPQNKDNPKQTANVSTPFLSGDMAKGPAQPLAAD